MAMHLLPSHHLAETEADGIAPLVFVKVEEQSIANELNQSVEAEEQSIKDEPNETATAEATTSNEWEFLKTIPSADISNFVRSLEGGFRFKSKTSSVKGVVRYYYCCRVKVNAKVQCNRKVMVYIPNTENDEGSVSIKGQHTCNEMDLQSKAKTPLQPDDYSTIYEMLRTGMPKREIKKLLKTRNNNISTTRLNYAVKKASAEIYGNGTLSLGKRFLIIITIQIIVLKKKHEFECGHFTNTRDQTTLLTNI